MTYKMLFEIHIRAGNTAETTSDCEELGRSTILLSSNKLLSVTQRVNRAQTDWQHTRLVVPSWDRRPPSAAVMFSSPVPPAASNVAAWSHPANDSQSNSFTSTRSTLAVASVLHSTSYQILLVAGLKCGSVENKQWLESTTSFLK